MRVLDQLRKDYARYGTCQYLELDTYDIFAIERLHPWASQVEVEFYMDKIKRAL